MTITCAECGAPVAADARFCAACGAKLAPAGGAASREVRKLVTVLFADVTGSTALGERLDPEALRALMNRYFARMRSIIEAHGGTVEKFIGDAVMAVFGIPQVHEDDALRAVRAAAEIRDALGAMNEELEAERGIAIRFRTGLTTGEVVAGDPASGTTLVTGDTVNTAARLEQAAPPGEILMGRLTWSLVRDAVDAEPVEPIAAKGKAEPVEAWRLISVRAGAEGHARHLDAPLVGRERELERLASAFRSAVVDRSCALFTLLGSAGVGKSRLTAEFIDSVAGEATVVRGRCLSYGEGITYWPVGEIVRAVAGITEADDALAALAKVRALLDDGRDTDVIADRIGSAIGLSAAQAPKEEVAWAFRRLLEHLAADRPVVVVIDDVHWADQTLLDLIEHCADWSRDAAILLLCPARPELLDAHPGWGGGKLNATTVLLEPLTGDATARLIEALPGGGALPAQVVERVMTAAEGNPLYVEELLGMLVDDGMLRQGVDGAWESAPGLLDVQVPASITVLLAARLERLAPEERRVAEHASVVGRVFEQAAVVELATDDARPAVPRALLSLVRKELVRPERGDLLTTGDAFKFRHVLIRDAAYEALPKVDRAQLHERVADWLLQVAGDRLGEIEEIVGYHLEQAHIYRVALGDSGPGVDRLARRAAEHYISAGLRAEDRDDSTTVIALLGHAVELAGAPNAESELLRLRIARATSNLGQDREALDIAEEVRARAIETGDLTVEARATMLGISLRSSIAEPGVGTPEFTNLLDDARNVVERAGDPEASAAYWRDVSSDAWENERFPESHDALIRAAAFSREAGDERGLREADAMTLVEHLSGTTPLEEALSWVDDVLAKSSVAGEIRAFYLARRGLIRSMMEDPEGGLADGHEAVGLYLDLGMRGYAAEAWWSLAWMARLTSDLEGEVVWLEPAIAAASATLAPMLTATRGLALAKLGRLDGARADLAATGGDAWYRTVRLRKLLAARIAVASGDLETALRIADEVEREVVPQAHFLNARSEGLLECGVIAALAGDTVTARRRGEAALETAARKDNRALARKARALIAGDLSRL